MTDWERPPPNDADRMVAYVRGMPAEELCRAVVDDLSDVELKHWMDALPDPLLDAWWRRAKEQP